MILRAATVADGPSLWEVMRASVHGGTAAFYDADARAAWLPDGPMPDWFPERVRRGWTVLGEAAGAGPAGFVTLWPAESLLDLIYVRPEAMGTGLADRLHDALVAEARTRGLGHLTVDGSEFSRRFLRRRGWRVTDEVETVRRGFTFRQTRLRLDLPR